MNLSVVFLSFILTGGFIVLKYYLEETKAVFFNKVNEIKNDLSNLDKESAKELAEENRNRLEKCERPDGNGRLLL